MLTTIDGHAKGSARSVNGFNIYDALKNCEDHILQYGGHQAAAGLTIELPKLNLFKEKFNEVVKAAILPDEISPECKIDDTVCFSDLTPKFLRILDEFAPFGPGNMRPVFLAENVQFLTNPRIVGVNHIISTIKQEGCEKVFDSIGFNLGSFASLIDKNKNLVDIVFTIEKTSRDGRVYPQLRIKDIKVKSNANHTLVQNNQAEILNIGEL